ncbi:MAG TPA: nascent polypeptide-associated complex protein [Methanomassiliicoccales archaeon]|nr:nascent polypeptide-associated complex protein [Methanomassiliicoccales archaeon]
MKQAMKRMGISTEDIEDVEEVIIRTRDKEYVIQDAQVTVMNMQGQKNYQITGEAQVRPRGSSASIKEILPEQITIPEDDIQLVMGQTGCSREKAVEALRSTEGQPAEAIIKIMSS